MPNSKKKEKKIEGKKTVEKEMSFLDHLEELRWHIIRSLIAILSIAIAVFLMKTFIFDNVIFAPKKPNFWTYEMFCSIADRMCFRPPVFDLITRELGEQFFTHIKVSAWLGLIVSFPYVFWEFWKFVKPGLYSNERKAARGIVFTCSFLFLLGVLFGYYIISPFAITFLAGYKVGADAINSPTLSSYVNYMTMFTIPTGIIFEMPIVIYFLAKVGLVTAGMMRSYRKHAVIFILVLAAIITPPDVVTQFLIGVPVYVLYEISILIAARMEKKYKASLDED